MWVAIIVVGFVLVVAWGAWLVKRQTPPEA